MTHRLRYLFDGVKADNQVSVSASVRGFFKGTVGGMPVGFLPASVSPLLRGTRGVVDSRFSPACMHSSHIAQASRSHRDATGALDLSRAERPVKLFLTGGTKRCICHVLGAAYG